MSYKLIELNYLKSYSNIENKELSFVYLAQTSSLHDCLLNVASNHISKHYLGKKAFLVFNKTFTEFEYYPNKAFNSIQEQWDEMIAIGLNNFSEREIEICKEVYKITHSKEAESKIKTES